MRLTERLLLTISLAAMSSPILGDDAYRPHIVEASDAGEKAIARFDTPDGFKIELVAAEPMLANPVAFCIDDLGRFFVVETFRMHAGVTDNRYHHYWLADDLAARTIEDRVNKYKKHLKDKAASFAVERDRLRLITDTDGDGKADTASVFADDFKNIEDGIGAGVLARGDSVWFTCIPHLWRLRDVNSDGIADENQSLSFGYGVRTSFFGHDLHGLIFGPDGKLYFSIGDRGLNVLTPRGRLDAVECGSVLRCEPDGSDLEIFHTGLRNPQELAFDELGNLITCDNNSDAGDRARIVHLVEGGDSGWRMPYQYIQSPVARGPWNEEKLWQPHFEGQAAYILPPVANFADGPSGLTYNPGVGFPPQYDQHFFLADFRGGSSISGLRMFKLRPKGATFELAKGEVFSWKVVATDVDFGYDGAMYVLDWVEGWDKPGKGRIYRYFHPEYRGQAKGIAELIAGGFEKQATPDLVSLLSHADMRVRQRAQFALAARGDEGETALTKVAIASGPLYPRLHAIWGLGQLGRRDSAALEPLLPLMKDADAEVRAQVARVLGDVRLPAAKGTLVKALKDDSPRVRFYAAIGLGRIGGDGIAPPLLSMVAENGDRDPYLRHAAVFGLAGSKDEAAIDEAMKPGKPESVRVAAAVVLRRWSSPKLQEFLTASDGFSVRLAEEAARAIYDLPIIAAYPALADLLERSDLPNTIRRRALHAHVRLGKDDNAIALARFAGDGRQPADLRREALDAIGNWASPPVIDPMIGNYRPLPDRDAGIVRQELERIAPSLLATTDVPLKESAITWIGLFRIGGVEGLLIEIFRQQKEQAAVRAGALRTLGLLNPADLTLLVREGLSDKRQTVRSESQKILARLDPTAAAKVLEQVLESGETREKQEAFETLGELASPEADRILEVWLARLKEGSVPDEARLDLRLAASKRQSDQVRHALRDVEEKRSSASDVSDRYLDCLMGGETRRGSAIFHEKGAVACLKCHKIDDKGGEVGPDLSKIGQTKDRRYLLESLVDPNKRIAEGFDSVVLLLADGTTVSGVLREETAEQVTVIDVEGKKHTVPKDQIEEREKAKSAMPEDVVTKLTEAEIRDLVEFLSRRK